jgi:hypothetical protein
VIIAQQLAQPLDAALLIADGVELGKSTSSRRAALEMDGNNAIEQQVGHALGGHLDLALLSTNAGTLSLVALCQV